MKTEIHNLIILDESGSMHGLEKATVSGCNETINAIRSSQAKSGEGNVSNMVSIYCFQSGGADPSRYLLKDVPVQEVKDLLPEEYRPCGSTPLLDAVGSTVDELRAMLANRPGSIGCVTVITDGYENSSTHYTVRQVAQLISQLKEMGWNFNFIGANIDVDSLADTLNIDNRMMFSSDVEGTREMFANFKDCQIRHSTMLSKAMSEFSDCEGVMNDEDNALLFNKLKACNKGFFSR